MLRELLAEANVDGHNKKLSDDHLKTLFDAVAHRDLDISELETLSHELGEGDDYDRTKGGAYLALMRMYICIHAEPPHGDVRGNWWKGGLDKFISFCESEGIHDPAGNAKSAGAIADHKIKESHAARTAERAGREHGLKWRAADKAFTDRWKSLKPTVSPAAAQKAVELARDEIVTDMAKGTSVHAAIAKVVSQHHGLMESAKVSFIEHLTGVSG